MDDIEARVERLLNQLENPNLTEREVEKIQNKIAFLQGMQS